MIKKDSVTDFIFIVVDR